MHCFLFILKDNDIFYLQIANWHFWRVGMSDESSSEIKTELQEKRRKSLANFIQFPSAQVNIFSLAIEFNVLLLCALWKHTLSHPPQGPVWKSNYGTLNNPDEELRTLFYFRCFCLFASSFFHPHRHEFCLIYFFMLPRWCLQPAPLRNSCNNICPMTTFNALASVLPALCSSYPVHLTGPDLVLSYHPFVSVHPYSMRVFVCD